MKKKYLLVLISILIVVIGGILILQSSDSQVYQNSKKDRLVYSNGPLALMLETAPGSGEYEESNSNTWPGENYVFNPNLSRCEKGSTLLWDSETNAVLLEASTSDTCYVYFDMYNSVKITEVTTSTTYNSVTLTVASEAGENEIAKYYFTRNDGPPKVCIPKRAPHPKSYQHYRPCQ